MEKKKSKFNNKRSESCGRSFASQGERDCFEYLKLLERAGEIDTIECQVSVRLTEAAITYKADFAFWDHKLEQKVWAEYKGFETAEWRLKRRLWKVYGPGHLRVYAGTGTRIFLKEEIIPS